jgi:hypothetical protein
VERIKASTGLARSAKKIWKLADADASKRVDVGINPIITLGKHLLNMMVSLVRSS